ncbi:ras-related protein Rab-39B [Sorex fumeus]|uniref:ras-related protein Rab-39B n=1 Tax=Sorex fumeus TaxID=62283 RepID=UPI0024ADCE0A|nr:ras-related protein Rab-39B [Sorex fumeus]
MLLPFHHLCERSTSIPPLSWRLGLPPLGLLGRRCFRCRYRARPKRVFRGLGGVSLSSPTTRAKETCLAPVMEAIWLYQFRLIVIGDSTVGKSCLIRRFTEGRFAQVSDPTVGVDFFSRLVEIEPGKRIKLQIWDTAGQERFRSITRAYYRNSVGGLLLFDITNRRSFQNVHEWLEETKVHVQPYQIVFVLVGHKCDLDTQRQVTRHEAEKLAAAYGMKYIETSARDAINVEKAFTDLTRDIYELVKRGDITIQEGWEGVKSGFVPNVVHSSEEVVKSERRCLC